jgi:aspartate aminotransferase
LAAHAAIDENFTKYTPTSGIAELKRASCDRYRSDYGVQYSESEVIVSAGGKQALFNAALALFGPGDEVITHAPDWPTLTEQIKLADATSVLVRTHADDGFAIRAATILAAITPRTRGVIINSPCNPTGALISRTIWRRLPGHRAPRDLDRGRSRYEKLIYDAVPHNLPGARHALPRPGGYLRIGLEAYAMTGWRCGWTIAPAAVVAACNAIQSHSTSNVSSITQKAVVAALNGSQAPVRAMLDEYRTRRDKLSEWRAADPRLHCRKPAGAFYMFVDVGEVLSVDGMRTTIEFAQALLDEALVAVTPGEAFDAPGFIRLSYATTMENLREGSRRLLEFVAKHADRRSAAVR